MHHCFLVKLAYQETFLQAKTILKQWEALVHQSHLGSNDEGIRLTTYLDMAQDDGFTLMLIFLHLPWDINLSTHHFSNDCFEYGSKSISHFKWPWMHKLTQFQWIAIGLLYNHNWERIMNIYSIHQPYPWIINLIAEIKEPCSTFLLVQNTPIGLIKEYATITMQMAKIRLLSRTNLHWNNAKHLRTNHVFCKGDIVYQPCHLV